MASTTRATPSVTMVVSSSANWSSKAKPYWKPEQPPPVTYRRSFRSGLPSSSISSATLAAAWWVNSSSEGIRPGRAASTGVGLAWAMAMFLGRWLGDGSGSGLGCRGGAGLGRSALAGAAHRLLAHHGGLAGVAGPVVGHRRLDGVFGQDGAVDLHGRQRQFFGDLGVLDVERLVQRAPAHPFGDQRARRNRRAAAIGLEAGVLDHAGRVHADLQPHHIAAGRGPDHAGAHALVLGAEGPHVAGVFIVVDHLVAVSHGVLRVWLGGMKIGRLRRRDASVRRPLDAGQVDAGLHHVPQRAHGAQALDHLADLGDGKVDLGLGGEAPSEKRTELWASSSLRPMARST